MSTTIWAEIRAKEGDGRLVMVRPLSPRERIVRPMFATPAVSKMLTEEYDESIDVQRAASLQADLEVFVTGQPIDPGYLKPLKPIGKNVWEIRSVRPRPSIRVFGRFADRDVFVATNYFLRKPLGAFKSLEWKDAIHVARQEWARLFTRDPIEGKLHELVSGVLNG